MNFLEILETELECTVLPHSRKLLPTSFGTSEVGTSRNLRESFLTSECYGIEMPKYNLKYLAVLNRCCRHRSPVGFDYGLLMECLNYAS